MSVPSATLAEAAAAGRGREVAGVTGDTGTRTVLVPDLDEDLTAGLGEVEELLMTLRWQEEEDPDGSVQHPPALAGGAALQALRRVADTVRLTQTNPDTWAGVRVLGPDGRYEHTPLRFVRLWRADIAALSAVAAALGEPVRSEEVAEALRMHAAHRPADPRAPDPVAGLVSLVARVAGLLDLAWTEDAELLRARLQPTTQDVVLTVAEEAAYQRTVTRLNSMWALGSGVDRLVY